MRWVFISLVLINVFYFGVKLFEANLPEASVPQFQPNTDKVPQIVLLRESTNLELKDQPSQQPVSSLCPMVGPFEREDDGRDLVSHLKKAGYAAVLKTVVVPEPELAWVYIPSLDDWDESLQVLKRLQRDKVDSFIVGEEGEFKNAISLGYFENTESAEGLQVKLVAAGYDVKIQKIERTHDELWVMFDQKSLSIDEGASINAYLENKEDLVLQEQACLSS